MNKIYDLDGTLICSKHRQCTLSDGTLNLPNWVKNNTADKIANDSLLPAIETIRKDRIARHNVIICTARVLSNADYIFFMDNDLTFDVMLDRPAGCSIGDADLKEMQLRLYAHSRFFSWDRFCKESIFYDDSEKILDRMARIGIATIDANYWNSSLVGAR